MSEKYELRYNLDSHGRSGPLNTSFAGMISEADLPLKEVIVLMSYADILADIIS